MTSTPRKTLLAAGLSAACSCALIFTSDTTGPQARKLVSDGAQLLDVRSPSEYAAGHVDGAVNIPVSELEARLGEVASPDSTVVVYCRSGHRSARAAQLLKEHGWRDVHNLGPMSYW